MRHVVAMGYIYYQPPTQDYVDKKTTVRVGLVQWQMRPYKTLDDVFEQVEFFVDAVSDYKSDFVLFPEYFNAPLMAKFNHLGEAQSIRGLAQYTEEVRDRFINLAISYNINIITGSMPYVKEDGGLYNVGFLVRRDGTYEMYEKVHVTPDEIKSWGLSGGKMVQTFDTDCAKIGILICYDVVATMGSGKISQILEGKQPIYVSAPGLVSGNLTWEKVTTANIGMDINFFDNRLTMTGEFYIRRTKDMLTKGYTLPAVLGTSVPKQNAANLKTRGWEVTVGWKDQLNLCNKPFIYNANFNLADSRAWITKYDNPTGYLGAPRGGQ